MRHRKLVDNEAIRSYLLYLLGLISFEHENRRVHLISHGESAVGPWDGLLFKLLGAEKGLVDVWMVLALQRSTQISLRELVARSNETCHFLESWQVRVS